MTSTEERREPLSFAGWVRKWRIGPGMNDRRPEILDWIGTHERMGYAAEAAEMRALRAEGLYSGFDGRVGQGWVPLLDRLAADLVAMGWDRDLHQVKEKFSTLRFYVGRSTRKMTQRIRAAEAESARTCCECGCEVSVDADSPDAVPGWCPRCRAAAAASRGPAT